MHSSTGASEQIAAQIRVWLEQQQLQTGERIGTEQELADEFGVSRPTLREALRLLSAAHLIRVGRGRTGGIFVARHAERRDEPQPLGVDRADARGPDDLDGGAARRAAFARGADRRPRGGQRRRRRRRALEEAIEAAAGIGRAREPFNAADSRFHQILAEASGNDLLHALTGWILEVLQPTLVDTISARVDAEAILAQHRAILRAVRRRQRLAAERAMQAHIEYLVQVLDEGE